MNDDRDTDTFDVSGFDDTASFVLEAFDDTLDADAVDPTDRIPLPRARTQPDWPPAPPPPRASRRHRAVHVAVTRPQTASDSI
jgi:hypothetical protein